MNHLKPLPTNPILNSFFQERLTPHGQLVTNETHFHDMREQAVKSACCRSEVYYIDIDCFCSTCGSLCDRY
ncbi:MAG: hypothetical protein JWQ09_5823 [Segetibacter sp.]|nr:hypothetical protein [Segetibacter sp.]